MSALDRSQLAPPYPVYDEKGIIPLSPPFGPPDLRPSGLGPGYSTYASAHGRNLAGMNNFDQKNSEGIESYPNELNLLAQSDDVNGNGVFDPNDTHGNVHPEDGIFQDHLSLPGDVARSRSFAKGEVQDLTKRDGFTMYVPGGAVSFQGGQERTYNETQLLWEAPSLDYSSQPEEYSIVNAPTATTSVGADETVAVEDNKTRNYLIAAGAGVVAGSIILMLMKKKGRK